MTPSITDIHLEKLLDKIKLQKSSGVYIDVEPELDAEILECIPNVRNKINTDGGKEVLGWQIWKTDILIEAEFHSIWQSPNGTLKDITPKQEKIEKILFFPDERLIYDGSQKDNIRCNFTENRLVDDFIQLSETLFKILNKGKRKYEKNVMLSNNDIDLYKGIEMMRIGIDRMLKQGFTRNSPCYCGNTKKYKHCHGKKLSKTLEKI